MALKYGSTEYKEARKRIDAELATAYAAIGRAQGIADETGLSFSFELCYGAGATYDPTAEGDEDDGKWLASSQSCWWWW